MRRTPPGDSLPTAPYPTLKLFLCDHQQTRSACLPQFPPHLGPTHCPLALCAASRADVCEIGRAHV